MHAAFVIRLCALVAGFQKSMAGVEAPKKNVVGNYTSWWEFDNTKSYTDAASICSKNTWPAEAGKPAVKQCGADGAALVDAATQADLIKSANTNFGKHEMGTGPTATESKGKFWGVDKTKLYTINANGTITSEPMGAQGNSTVRAGFICVKMNSICTTTTIKKTMAKTTAKETTMNKTTKRTTRSKKDQGKITEKMTTTTTTTTTNNRPKVEANRIEGSLSLTVPDADKAIKDAKFKQAVIDGIAASAKCPAKYIKVTMSKARRLNTNLRRLALVTKTLKVDYTMTIPAKNPTKTAYDKVLADLKALTKEKITTSIQEKVTAAKGKDYTITVTSKTAATSTKIKIDAPTTAAPVLSSALNNGVHGIWMIVSLFALTLLA